MKSDLFIRNLLIIIVIFLALNIILFLLSNPSSSYAAKNIEYKLIHTSEFPYDDYYGAKKEFLGQYEKIFNEYGKEGWEYIGVILRTNFHIFKR